MSLNGADQLLIERVRSALQPRPPARIGVAVSGGSDSAALLHLLHEFAGDESAHGRRISLRAVTVDHGLRPEARSEAAAVGEMAQALGIEHDILHWTAWDGSGNLQDRARRARYGLMAQWAEAQGIHHIALGHTADDQAETVLMRLGRAAGVDGLAAMSPRRAMGAVTLLRPLLAVRREALRDYLRVRGIGWIDDPSNEDSNFERVRARKALREGAAGLSVEALCTVAQNMTIVRAALGWQGFAAARQLVRFDAGDVVIDQRGFRTLPVEVGRRILQQALQWVSGAEYAPRGQALSLLMESLRGGTAMTLQGCKVAPSRGEIRVFREYQAVSAIEADLSQGAALWDGRWRLRLPEGVSGEGLCVRAMGEEGAAQCRLLRARAAQASVGDGGSARVVGTVSTIPARPAASLLSSPCIWRADVLIAAPLAGCGEGWEAELTRDSEGFFGGFLA